MVGLDCNPITGAIGVGGVNWYVSKFASAVDLFVDTLPTAMPVQPAAVVTR
jgi:hypothetical protein